MKNRDLSELVVDINNLGVWMNKELLKGNIIKASKLSKVYRRLIKRYKQRTK